MKWDERLLFSCINIASWSPLFFSDLKYNLQYHAYMTYPDFVLFSWGSTSLIRQVRELDLPSKLNHGKIEKCRCSGRQMREYTAHHLPSSAQLINCLPALLDVARSKAGVRMARPPPVWCWEHMNEDPFSPLDFSFLFPGKL